ncbi:MAG TPA: AI-2E family transporter [Micromonosporaceae bacterium]
MGQLENMRENLRRAYESGRASVRQARAEARAADLEELIPVSAPVSHRPIVVASTSVSHRDDLDVPRGLRVAAAWTWRLLLLMIAGVAVLWLVGMLQVVVVPVVIATLLSALLSPVAATLRRRGMSASLAATVVLIGGMAAVGGTFYLVISQLLSGAPDLANKAEKGIGTIQTWLKTGPFHLNDDQLAGLVTEVRDWFTNNRDTLTSGALSTATTLGHVLTGMFLVLFTTFFFVRDGRRITRFGISLLPHPTREAMASAAIVSWGTLVSYVRATVLVAFIDALGIGLAMVILKVQFAFPLAALVFIGAFIPIVGATVSGAVAVLVALVDRGPVVALILLAAVIAVQQLEGHVLQPLIMGRAVAIHPLAVILAIAAGIVLAGIVGALVAVPIVAVLNTGIRHLAARRREEQLDEAEPDPAAGFAGGADHAGAPPATDTAEAGTVPPGGPSAPKAAPHRIDPDGMPVVLPSSPD